MPISVEDVDAPHVRSFLLAEEQRMPAASAAVDFRNIHVFFGWLSSEGERKNPNPMDRVEAPKVTKKTKTFFTEEELVRLLKTCSGATFVDRRDTAVMRIFIDTGLRVSGLARLRYDPDDESANDVFLAQRRLRIRLRAETRPGCRSEEAGRSCGQVSKGASTTRTGVVPATLADSASIPVELDDAVQGRYPQVAETAAYLVVAEAIEDATGRGAGYAAVTTAHRDGCLSVTVEDDGQGRTSPMADIADRVGALGGVLTVEPTWMGVEIPCG